MPVVAPIVEGYGDVDAVPVLVRRIAPSIQVARPVRFPKSKLLVDSELTRAAGIASSNLRTRGLLLLVMDADEQCAASIGASRLRVLADVCPQHDVFVAIAVREFESWLVGGIEELGIADPEAAGHPKQRLREQFGVYSETVDQPRLTAKINLDLLQNRSRSFSRIARRLRDLESQSEAP